ncbi:MAG: hypothetical protein WC546_05535 [Candidatus Omnitrophota bacterium]
MKKNIVLFGLMLVAPLCLYAQGAETITITTYYPSPHGVYEQLVTSTLGVGDNDDSGTITSADAPDPATASQRGNLWVSGNIGIRTGVAGPQRALHVAGNNGIRIAPVNVTTIANPQVGDVAVNSTDSTLKWYNGSGWASAGGGTSYVAYFPYIRTGGPLDPAKDNCLDGFTDQGSLGKYGGCWYPSTTFSYFLPPNGICDTNWGDQPFYLGEAHLCCRN